MYKGFIGFVFQVVCNEHPWGQDSAGARSCVARYVPEAVFISCTIYHGTILCIPEICISNLVQPVGHPVLWFTLFSSVPQG